MIQNATLVLIITVQPNIVMAREKRSSFECEKPRDVLLRRMPRPCTRDRHIRTASHKMLLHCLKK